MNFRLELAHGNGKPRFWEVNCEGCEAMAHFEVPAFPDFPSAFFQAVKIGWDVQEDVRGRVRYFCSDCAQKPLV